MQELGFYPENGITRYFEPDTGEIVESNHEASIVVGYAHSLAEAEEQNPSGLTQKS